MNSAPMEESDLLEAVAFVGDSLSPFFLDDPAAERVRPLYEAFGRLDPATVAGEWPFVDSGEAAHALDLMVSGLRDFNPEALSWEYRRLFVGPGHKEAAPWGSVYTDHDGVIFGKSALDLRRWLAHNGIASLGSASEPDDHIGLMLALMAWIARERPALLREYLQLHLLTWEGHYFDLLERVTRQGFFQGLARLTRASLGGLQEQLAIAVEPVRFYR